MSNLVKWVFTLCLSITIQQLTIAQQAWEEVISADGSKPHARHEAAFVQVGKKLILLGGRGIKPVNIFDVDKKVWTNGATPPVEMHHFQPVVYKNKVYIICAMTGGYPGETPLKNIYIYDIKKDEWTQGATIPENRLRGSTGNVVYNGKIYISCGIKNGHIGDHKNWLDVYDPKIGTWTQLPDAPRARDHFQAAVVNNKLYVAGGRQSKAPNETFTHTIGEVDVFDFKTSQWTTLSQPLPTHRAGSMTIGLGNDMVVVGGESLSQDNAHNQVEAYNTSNNSWHNYPSLITGRHGSSVVKYKDHIYVAAGCGRRGGNPELDTMERLKVD
ncbi:galactose oxidase [Flavobacteriaceae bacterium XHP0103]|uniref:Kelch repeat-containing protein n=1 Tax=Marixanthotalea marina TaxID=2844359 RepID=UPI002989A3D0|nr:kelch repeat-containing protein [Marixanthotalea marina]MBU3821506.1 galactose oxidase [Marixanthotalea marina]